jgi:hypothetical protein
VVCQLNIVLGKVQNGLLLYICINIQILAGVAAASVMQGRIGKNEVSIIIRGFPHIQELKKLLEL